jgi:hypothetical protein
LTGTGVTTGNSSVNTQITANGISTGNTTVTGNTVATGNSTINTAITGTSIVTGNSSTNTAITANGVTTGNTVITGNTVSTGNASVNTQITANGVTTGNTTITGTILSTGNASVNTAITADGITTGNTVVTGNAVSTGNATVNTQITSNTITTANSSTNTVVTPGTITLGGTTTINSLFFSGTANNANYVKANTGIVSNSSGVFVDPDYAAALTVNNATYFGGQLPSYYLTTGGISGNVAQLTANNVYYVGDVTAVNVVSNSQLTANLAYYTNTASLYLDTLVDVNSAGPTSGQVLTWNSSTNLWTPQAVPAVVANVVPGYYGSFYDNSANQTITTTTSAYLVRIANTFEQNGVTVINNTDITFAYSGTYEISYSIQYDNTASEQQDINIWFYKNGNNNVADSDSRFTIHGKSSGGNNGKLIAVTPFLTTVTAGDYYRIAWAATSNAVSIVTIPAGTTPTTPQVPGVILTAKGISNIISAPPGSNSQIAFNDNGISNASPGFTFNKTTNNVTIGNNLIITQGVNAASHTVGSFFVANSTFVYVNNGIYFTPKVGTTTNTSEGSVFYDSTNRALNVYTDSGDPHELGQQTFARVYNSTGSTITKGTAVYIDGANSNRPTIGKAISNGAIGLARAIGIVYNDISGTSEGFVLTGGLMQNVDTRSYFAGQEIYVSAATAGALSNTQPGYPNYSVPIGYALNSALVGQMYITTETATLTLPNTNIYISNGSGPFISNNFTFDYANSVLNIGNSSVNAAIGYVNTAGTTTFFKLEANTNSSLDGAIVNFNSGSNASADFAAYDSNGPSSSNFIDMGINGSGWSESFWTINGPSDGYLYTGNTNLSIGTAQAQYINFFTGGTLAANERMRITPTGNVGIGNTAPVHKFSVKGISYFDGNTTFVTNVVIGSAATLVMNSASGIWANGTLGSNGSFLTTNGSAVYWSSVTGNVTVTGITTNSLAANAINITTGTLTVGNSTVNTDIGNNYISVGNNNGYVNVYSNYIYIGNAASNATVNSTVYTGTANNTSFVGTVSAANVVSNAQLQANLQNYVNTTGSYTLSGNVAFNANLIIGSAGDLYINAAAGIWANGGFGSNNSVLSSNGTAVYWASGLTSSSLTANSVAITTGTVSVGNSTVNTDIGNNYISVGNSTSYVNIYSSYIFIGNGASNATINSTTYTGSANNASNLGGVAAASYVNTSGNYTLTGNVTFNANLIIGSAGDLVINASAGIWANGSFGPNNSILTSNGSAVYWSNGLTSSSLTANSVAITTGTITVGNSTVNTDIGNNYISVGNNSGYSNIYSGYISLGNSVSNAIINSTTYTGTANNALYLGGVAAASYVNTSGNYTLSGNTTFSANLIIGATGDLIINATAGFWANGGFGTAGQVLTTNSSAVYWANATVNGAITASNLASDYINIGIGFLTVGNSTVNTTVTNTVFRTGNSSVYSVTNSTTISVNNAVLTGYISANGSNGTSGQVLTTNGAGVYWSTVSGGGGSWTGGTMANTAYFSNTAASGNATSGAVTILGGLGVANNIYVGGRVGFSNASNISVVYQQYNATTGSLDVVFG